MNGLNRAYLLGRLGGEPEVRVTAGGKKLVKVSLATPNHRKVGDEWVEEADWHRLTAWERDAEFLEKYAHKGDAMCVECAIKPGKWVDTEGKTHYETNLVIQRVSFLQSRTRGETRPGPDPVLPSSDGEEEQIPF